MRAEPTARTFGPVPTLGERIVEHLTVHGASLDDGELAEALGVHRPVIAETCRQLEADGLVVRNMAGGTRTASVAVEAPVATPTARAVPVAPISFGRDPLAVDERTLFPVHARRVLSGRWGTSLHRRAAGMPGGAGQTFELVSGNGRIVGDVVWLDGRGDTVEAKDAAIAEAVLIVGHVTRAHRRFLVFGQDEEVVRGWLARYRLLLDEVEVWFLDGDRLERLA